MEALANILADTTFLIDLQRERRGGPKHATAYLERNPERLLSLCTITAGEFLSGFDEEGLPAAKVWLGQFPILPVTAQSAEVYAAYDRRLRRLGLGIGSNDLWIGSVAVASGLPLLTRNAAHFSRLPGLAVERY